MFKREIFIIIAVYVAATMAFYAPYVIKKRFDVVERNWDGPAYIVIAKTLYNPKLMVKENYIRKYLPRAEQFANKMPLYPLMIRTFSFLGYEKSMIFVSWFSGLLCMLVFYYLLKTLKIAHSCLLTIILIFLPRWFVMQKVGGVEPTLLFFSLLSLLFYYRQKYFWSAFSLMLATLTKVNALLILLSYIVLFLTLERKNLKKLVYYAMSPISVLVVFYYFKMVYGNFWVYFVSDGRCYEYVTLFRKLYGVFDASACYVGSINLEEMFWFYAVGFLAIINLISNRQWKLLIFFVPSFIPMLFLQHNDFTRLGIYLYFLLGIIYAKYLVKREVLIIVLLLLPAVYLYARNFINVNIFIP